MKINMLARTVAVISLIMLISACTEDNPVQSSVSDAQQLQALKDISYSHDSVTYSLSLPQGASSGQSYTDLKAQDSSTYTTLSNYKISFNLYIGADNSASGASDAKFDGLVDTTVFNNISTSPVIFKAPAISIPKGKVKQITATANINLETNKAAGKYIFQQIAGGDNIEGVSETWFLYKIGLLEDEFPLPAKPIIIPTRASPATKAFLQDLLNSGALD